MNLNHRYYLMYEALNYKEKKEDVSGKPEVEKDEQGNVTSYENTETVAITAANTTIDTEFVPFRGENWEMHIRALFPSTAQTDSYPTLFCCMSSNSPWPGFLVRYEDTQLYFIANDSSGNKHYYKISTNSSGIVDIYIYYNNSKMSATNNSTSFMSNVSLTVSLEDISLTLGADVDSTTGKSRRYGVCTIYDFYIKQT